MKKNPGMKIRNCKKRGEWVELVFMVRAVGQRLRLSKPWGESSGYDFAVELESGRMVRVQVKSTMFKDRGGYSCSVRGSKGPYKGNPFDFLAAYVIPEDVWYIIPAAKFKMQGSVALYPRLSGSKYDVYKEAWHLLGVEAPGVIDRIEACAEWAGEAVELG